MDQSLGEEQPVSAYDTFVEVPNAYEIHLEIDPHRVGNSALNQSDAQAGCIRILYGIKSVEELERAVHEM